MDGRPFSAVLLSGVLTGSELTSWGIVHPTLWKLEHREQVRAEKLVYKRFGSIDPFLMTATTAASFVAASGLHGRSRAFALTGGGCYTAMLAITLIGNMPINLRVFRWDEDHGDPEEWRRLRRRWDRLHNIRIPLDAAGFVLITLAALHAPSRHTQAAGDRTPLAMGEPRARTAAHKKGGIGAMGRGSPFSGR